MFLQATTEKNKKLILNLCFNYGGMQDITQAAVRFKHGESNDFAKLLLTKNLPNVDLLIRTGNEKRISNFMLFQLAYAEIIFESTY
jgi:undecaprenyl diphosphate synthase